MNASVEALPVAHRAQLAPVPAPEMVVREGILDVPGEVSLYHGGRLSGIRIAWRLAGPANAPVVCALGGISANRRVFDQENPKQGWWSEVVGPGQALDAERFRVSELRLPRRERGDDRPRAPARRRFPTSPPTTRPSSSFACSTTSA